MRFKILSCILFFSFAVCANGAEKIKPNELEKKGFTRAEEQIANQLAGQPNTNRYPRTSKNGKLVTTPKTDWTEGFFPGCIWYVYQYNHKDSWKKDAIRWTEALESLKTLTSHHDIGFLMYCSYGNAYRLTGNKQYRDVLITAARSLCTRFNEKVGCIKSWNYRKAWNGKDEWFYPVIIDNMMNLELLYFAAKETGDTLFTHVANRHAETTAKYHFRDDYSTYHVVDYSTKTGQPLHRATCQGFSDNSMWARGQAWAIYGFTMAYRETKRKDFLNVAVHAADRWLSDPNLPKDGVPYWDFNAGQPGYKADWNYDPQKFNPMPRDASAAAITASALLELAKYVSNGAKYKKAALHILNSLTSPEYLAEKGTNCNFVLKHSVGSIPHGAEIDVPLVYADYYYLEALLRANGVKTFTTK